MSEYRIDIEAYVVSFCARADLALQWLHYGRSGSGAALGLASGLEVKPFELVPVLYNVSEQDRFLTRILRAVFEVYSTHTHHVGEAEREEFDSVAAHIAAQYIWAVGAQLKDPAFSGEEEWRLMTLEMIGARIPDSLSVHLETEFRTGLPLASFHTKVPARGMNGSNRLFSGTRCQEPDDPAIRTLFRECTRRDIPTTRSPLGQAMSRQPGVRPTAARDTIITRRSRHSGVGRILALCLIAGTRWVKRTYHGTTRL
jgi:hypothetical protein